MLTDERLLPLLHHIEQHFGLIGEPLLETLRTALLELARGRGVAAEDLAARLAAAAPDDETSVELVSRLLLGHTHFYRHGRVWEWLGEQLTGRFPKGPVKALVAGCSSGEEAYTLAALLSSRYGTSGYEVQAVDVNPHALDVARNGRYAARDTAKLPVDWQERLLEPGRDGTTRFHVALRTRIRFGWCNLTQGVPEGPFHLVTLRNVLTYMTADATRAILDHVRRQLSLTGLLVVAPHESFLVTEHTDLAPVAGPLPIFARGDVLRSAHSAAQPSPRPAPAPEPPSAPADEHPEPERVADRHDGPRLVCDVATLHPGSPAWQDLLAGLREQLRVRPGDLLLDLSVVHRVDNQVQQSIRAAVRLLRAGGTRVKLRGPLAASLDE